MTMAGVLLYIVLLPFLQLAEASDLERRQLGASLGEPFAKIGVNAQDFRRLDDTVEKGHRDLDIHSGGHRERMRRAIRQLTKSYICAAHTIYYCDRHKCKQLE